MALMEVKHCYEIDCKYRDSEFVCPGDWFDDEEIAKCTHPEAPKNNSLGCSRDSDYEEIPDWCPLAVHRDTSEFKKDLVSDVKEVG